MYVPKHFEETRVHELHRLIRDNGLGTLVTLAGSGLEANHIPFEIDPGPGPWGTLRAHVARNNPVWQDFSSEIDALVVFQGAQAYISPSWYPSKQEDGKVVPTYNYLVAHAYGRIKVIEDTVWLRGLVERLTNQYEASMPAPWKVSDAPDDYIDRMLPAIVGIEIPVDRLIGKWKVSQNRSAADRNGVALGLQAHDDKNADKNPGSMAMAVRESRS